MAYRLGVRFDRAQMRLLARLLGLALLCFGCSSAPLGGRCQRSPQMLAALSQSLKQCVSNTDCPCGSSCALGVCSYDCVSDDDCAEGQSCDGRGHCAAR